MDNKTLKELASHIGSEIREHVGIAHDRIDELAADVAALPEVQHGRDGKHGEQGERGEKGDPGEAIVGPQGEQGPQGESIVGPQGEKGEKGDDGESIVGPQGERGEKGDPGESIEGAQGEQGVQGEKGDTGDTGTGIDVPFWSADEVYREGVEVQHHFGQFFRAKKDTAESPDAPESWERVGSSGFRLTGPFSKEAEYRDGDLFVKDFGLFLHSSGKSTLIAGRGPEGKKGKAGATGRDGKDGVDGQDGQDGADGSLIEALELRGANLVAVFKNADGTVKDHSVSLDPFLQTAALVTKEAAATEKKSIIEEADEYVRKLWNSLSSHLDAEDATPISFYRGIWRMDVSYQVGDWVRYGTEGLICRRANTGIVPHNYPTSTVDSSEYWQAITGLPSHGVGTAGNDSGGGSGVTPLDVLVKEGGQGGTKFSQFASTSGEGITGVGVQGGKNVKFELTTDAVAVNPNPFRNAKNGQFAATPKELENIKNQRDVNEFLYERIVDIEAGDIEIPPGTIVSDTPPVDPEEGQGWYDTGRLELFVYANEGWFPCSPLGARIEEGEVVQAQILERLETGESKQETIAAEIVHALGEQSAIEGRVKIGEGVQQEIKSDLVTLENKVKQIEGAVGEHTLNFTQSNQTPRHGEFNLLDDTMQMVYKIEEAAHIQISNVDADGSPVDIDRVGVGDVIRLAHGMTGMAELRVTSASDGFFSVTKINGDLSEMFVGPYGFVMLSQYDPAGVATIAYVDQQDEVLRQDTLTLNDYFERVTVKTEGANQLPDETDWKVRQHNSEGKNKTLIHSVGGRLGVYNLKEPTESHHAATKGYVDSKSDGVPSRPPGLKFMCSIVNLPNGYFQWWVKESTGNQHLELATTDGDGIAWGTNTPREDVRYTHHQPFTIWEVADGGWKMKVTGTISRIDFHPDHALCYVSSKTALNGGNFANGSGPYYITIGGVF